MKALLPREASGGGEVVLSNYFQDLHQFERADPELGLTAAFKADTKQFLDKGQNRYHFCTRPRTRGAVHEKVSGLVNWGLYLSGEDGPGVPR